MHDLSDEACSERLRLALDLAESGIEMRRAQLGRQFPHESDAEIHKRLLDWMLRRPDAPSGDAPGRVVDLETILQR